MRGAETPGAMLQPVAQIGQGGPAGVRLVALVGVRLAVQIASADGAEPGAVRAAEDLVGQREDEPVAGPRGEVEPVLGHVRSRQLLDPARALRLVLAKSEILLEDRVAEA